MQSCLLQIAAGAAQFGKDVLMTASATVTAVLVLFGIIWRIGRHHFDGQVIEALTEREKERFYVLLTSKLLAKEITLIGETHERGRRTHEAVERHIVDFTEHRRDIEGHLEVLVTIPQAVIRLTESLDRFDRMVEGLVGRVSSHDVALAEIRARTGRGRVG